MPRICTVCTYLQRVAVDTALVRGEGAFRTIADRFGLSATALKRHKAKHLPMTLVKAQESEDVAHAIDVVRQLKAINGASLQILNEARQTGNGELVLKAVDRVQRQIELRAKLLGELDDRPPGQRLAGTGVAHGAHGSAGRIRAVPRGPRRRGRAPDGAGVL